MNRKPTHMTFDELMKEKLKGHEMEGSGALWESVQNKFPEVDTAMRTQKRLRILKWFSIGLSVILLTVLVVYMQNTNQPAKPEFEDRISPVSPETGITPEISDGVSADNKVEAPQSESAEWIPKKWEESGALDQRKAVITREKTDKEEGKGKITEKSANVSASMQDSMSGEAINREPKQDSGQSMRPEVPSADTSETKTKTIPADTTLSNKDRGKPKSKSKTSSGDHESHTEEGERSEKRNERKERRRRKRKSDSDSDEHE